VEETDLERLRDLAALTVRELNGSAERTQPSRRHAQAG